MRLLNSGNKEWLYVLGFPKSGTTWFVHLLADTLETTAYSNGKKDASFDEHVGEGSKYKISHVHYLPSNTALNKDTKIVYIIRDFRDIVVSSFFHSYKIDENLVLLDNYSGSKIKRLFWRKIVFNIEAYKINRCWGSISGGNSALKFVAGLTRLAWLRQLVFGNNVGSWSEHIEFWTSILPNVVVLRFEDLLADPIGRTMKVMETLSIPYLKDKLHMAVERHSFDTRKESLLKRGEKIKVRHLRKGKSGDWIRFLDTRILKAIYKRHWKALKMFNYQT